MNYFWCFYKINNTIKFCTEPHIDDFFKILTCFAKHHCLTRIKWIFLHFFHFLIFFAWPMAVDSFKNWLILLIHSSLEMEFNKPFKTQWSDGYFTKVVKNHTKCWTVVVYCQQYSTIWWAMYIFFNNKLVYVIPLTDEWTA